MTTSLLSRQTPRQAHVIVSSIITDQDELQAAASRQLIPLHTSAWYSFNFTSRCAHEICNTQNRNVRKTSLWLWWKAIAQRSVFAVLYAYWNNLFPLPATDTCENKMLFSASMSLGKLPKAPLFAMKIAAALIRRKNRNELKSNSVWMMKRHSEREEVQWTSKEEVRLYSNHRVTVRFLSGSRCAPKTREKEGEKWKAKNLYDETNFFSTPRWVCRGFPRRVWAAMPPWHNREFASPVYQHNINKPKFVVVVIIDATDNEVKISQGSLIDVFTNDTRGGNKNKDV